MATTYAIDLVPVDARGRSAAARDWRTILATEPPERFLGFGVAVLAPASGTVVHVHDGEPDHAARRSQLSLIPYMLGQAGRLRRGVASLAGNHVILELASGRGYVALAHLRRGGGGGGPGGGGGGGVVHPGHQLAACGNSGNTTQPHVHLQVMDGADPMTASGVPMAFTRFREYRRGSSGIVVAGLPAEGSIIEQVD
jgi:murein DD-endopeptidase MepM/ murein hydrolase activator NlpD